MSMLVSVATAKTRLQIDDTAHDVDLELLIKAASSRVLAHIDSEQDFIDTDDGIAVDTAGIAEDVPEDIQLAVLYLVGAFLRDRDGTNSANFEQGFLPPAVTTLLYPYRTPGLA